MSREIILSILSVDQQDRELERRVSAFLAERNLPALRHLRVQSRRGVVTLSGRVRTFYEKQLSGHAARRVAGVVKLVDDVQVAAHENDVRPRFLAGASARGISDLITVTLTAAAPLAGFPPEEISSPTFSLEVKGGTLAGQNV